MFSLSFGVTDAIPPPILFIDVAVDQTRKIHFMPLMCLSSMASNSAPIVVALFEFR